MKIEVPDELSGGGGNFLKKAGTYHLIVTATYEDSMPPGKDGKQSPIDGFSVSLDVLDGTEKGQEGKTINATFFNGKLTSRDQGRFARVKQSAFLLATNVIDPSAKGKALEIDLSSANGHQLVARFEEDPEKKNDAGEHYLRIAGADTWHVDDPRADGFPKKADALKLIPEKFRHKPEWFDQIKPQKPSQGQSQQRELAGAGAGSSKSNVSFDDL